MIEKGEGSEGLEILIQVSSSDSERVASGMTQVPNKMRFLSSL
jgi:hypothetical protein